MVLGNWEQLYLPDPYSFQFIKKFVLAISPAVGFNL